MPTNLLNNYDEYGFALKSIKRMFFEEWYEPHIVIKYVVKNKHKNISAYGYAFKDFTYSLSTPNNKNIVNDLYNNLKDKNIFQSAQYLLENYPENAYNIINYMPSYVLTNTEFYNYLIAYISNLPSNSQNEIKELMNRRFESIDKYLKNYDSTKNPLL